jgi:hypothetical protein
MRKSEVFEITVSDLLCQILLLKALTLFAPVRQLQSRSFWDFPMISAVRNLPFRGAAAAVGSRQNGLTAAQTLRR